MVAAVAAVSPAAALPDRVRPARADPHAELRGLVIARGPLRRALAAVAGRLVATRAWEQLGFAYNRGYANSDALRLGVNIFAYALTH